VTITKGPHSKRHHGPYQASAKTAQGALQISDLGSRIRDGSASQVHHIHQNRSLVL
jgi:hypothetical protein